jgi:hypothetical protein
VDSGIQEVDSGMQNTTCPQGWRGWWGWTWPNGVSQGEEYSRSLTSYWSRVKNIPILWHPIGRVWRIFPFSDILLVACEEYSRSLTSYWSRVKYIPVLWHPIGRVWSIFPFFDILLVAIISEVDLCVHHVFRTMSSPYHNKLCIAYCMGNLCLLPR